MAAHYVTALCTPPLRVLTLVKSGRRMIPEKDEVFDHTHVVMLSIPCVNALYIAARKTAAFVTKTNFIVPKEFATFLKRALLVSGPTSRTIWYIDRVAFHVVFARKVSTAHRAVHTTRRDELHAIRVEHPTFH